MPEAAAAIGGLLVVYLAVLAIIGILQTVAIILLIMSIVKSAKTNNIAKEIETPLLTTARCFSNGKWQVIEIKIGESPSTSIQKNNVIK